MTALQLYKFVQENHVDFHWSEDNCYIHIFYGAVSEFTEMLSEGCFDDGGREAIMSKDHLTLDIVPICDYYDINPLEIFPKQ